MTRAFVYTIPLLVVLILASGCTRPLLGINLFVVGERTALERQVLGTYEKIGRDLATYASVRGVNPDGTLSPPPELTESQQQAIAAMNNRRYNRDDVDTLLRVQFVGEGRNGRLVRLVDQIHPVEGLSPELIGEIIAEENEDRETILARLMETTPGVEEDDREEVEWILAGLNRDMAPPGAMYQRRDGSWRMK